AIRRVAEPACLLLRGRSVRTTARAGDDRVDLVPRATVDGAFREIPDDAGLLTQRRGDRGGGRLQGDREIGQRRTQRHSGTDGGRQLRASPVGGGSVPRVVELQQETTLFVGPTTEGGRERARRCGVVGEGGQREGSFLVVACPDVRDTTAGLESESMQGL